VARPEKKITALLQYISIIPPVISTVFWMAIYSCLKAGRKTQAVAKLPEYPNK
jgi:hypothetical protein